MFSSHAHWPRVNTPFIELSKFAIYALLTFGNNDFLSSVLDIVTTCLQSMIFLDPWLTHSVSWSQFSSFTRGDEWLTPCVGRLRAKYYPHSSNQCRKWDNGDVGVWPRVIISKRISVKLIGPINNSPNSHSTNFSVHMQCSNMPYRVQFAFVFCYPAGFTSSPEKLP